MKKLFTLVLFFSVFVSAHIVKATGYLAFYVNRNVFIGGDSCNTRINDAISIGGNQFLFVGSSDCNNKGDIPATDSLQKGYNIIVGVIDSAYNLLWVKVYGGDDSVVEKAMSVCKTSDSGYAIVAPTLSTTGDISNSYDKEDIWLLKLDKNGNKQYEKTFGSSGADIPFSVKNDDAGNLLILGASNGIGNDISSHYGDSTTQDWVLIKLDTSGNKQWVKTIGGTGNESAEGELLVVDTNYYIISSSNSTDHNCNDTSWFNGHATGYNYHLLKLDTAGAVLWDKSYGGDSTDKVNAAVFRSWEKNIIMAGYTESDNNMVSGNDSNARVGWIYEVDLNGNHKYSKILADSPNVYATKTALYNPERGYGYCVIQQVRDTSAGGNKEMLHFYHIGYDGLGFYQNRHVGSKEFDNIAAIVPIVTSYRWYYFVFGTTADASSFIPNSNLGQKGPGDKGFVIDLEWGFYGSVNEIGSDGQLTIAPNPAGDYVTVEVPGSASGGNVMLLNMQGAVVMQKEMPAKKIQLNTSSLPRGMYMIQYTDKKNVRYVSKLILQ